MEIKTEEDKILTIEDPVEYQIRGITQIPVNEKKGLTFARGLRSILRHDPDKIMVGEIRDPETAQIAIQSALTGHLVFTTVHANNVFDVLGRFSHMQVDAYALVSALNGILAQRLVRIVCEQCAEPVQPSHEVISQSGLLLPAVSDWRVLTGRGCAQCRGTGYKGRRAVGEPIEPTCHGAAAGAVVADHSWARYGIVPWPATRLDAKGRLTHARFVLGDTYGEAVADWAVSLADAPPGHSYVACAMPATLRSALEDTLAPARLALVSL